MRATTSGDTRGRATCPHHPPAPADGCPHCAADDVVANLTASHLANVAWHTDDASGLTTREAQEAALDAAEADHGRALDVIRAVFGPDQGPRFAALNLIELTVWLVEQMPGDWPEKMLTVRGFYVGHDVEHDR